MTKTNYCFSENTTFVVFIPKWWFFKLISKKIHRSNLYKCLYFNNICILHFLFAYFFSNKNNRLRGRLVVLDFLTDHLCASKYLKSCQHKS